jgi:hypothetical protein
VHAMKVEEGGIFPLIFNLGINQRWLVSFTHRPFTFGATTTSSHWKGGWVGSRADLKVLEKRESLAPAWNWLVNLGFSARILFCIYINAHCLFQTCWQNCEKKLLVSSCPSVRLSAWNNRFWWNLRYEFLENVKKIQVSLKSDKNNGCFTWRPMYFSDITLNYS